MRRHTTGLADYPRVGVHVLSGSAGRWTVHMYVNGEDAGEYGLHRTGAHVAYWESSRPAGEGEWIPSFPGLPACPNPGQLDYTLTGRILVL